MAEETAIKDDSDVAIAPRLEQVANERAVAFMRVDGIVGKPASDAGHAPRFFGKVGDVECELPEIDRAGLDKTDSVVQSSPAQRRVVASIFRAICGVRRSEGVQAMVS